MNKLLFFLFLCLISLVIVGCGGNNTIVDTGKVVEFDMIGRTFEFEPNTITVKQGDTVIIHLYGEDDGTETGHGIGIPAFGINEGFRKGETIDIKFVADKKGTYPFLCSVYCGAGHGAMKGSIIVE